MSVDVGESLMQSWLRHVKHCDVVQTNWKAAMHLGFDKTLAEDLLKKMQAEFPFFGKKQKAAQIIRQLEIDALGYCVSEKKYVACDIAFHSSGLHYKKGDDAVPSKLLRTVLCLHAVLKTGKATVVFATPRFVSAADKKALCAFVETLNDCLKNKWGLVRYDVRLFSEEEFEIGILNPVLYLADKIQDTSEVFVRGIQLIASVRAAGAKARAASPSGADVIATAAGAVDISEMETKEILEHFVLPILSELPAPKLKPYFDAEESNRMFGCGKIPFLSLTQVNKGGNRYYSEAYHLERANQSVYVTNNCSVHKRAMLIDWINQHL